MERGRSKLEGVKLLSKWLYALLEPELKHAEAELKAYADTVRADVQKLHARHDSVVEACERATQFVDVHKIVMATCDHCHCPHRKFSISRVDGRIVCAACIAKGQR